MQTQSLKNDPRGYGAIPARQIISTVGDDRLGWCLCNRRLHVVRALRDGPDAALSAELELIDAIRAERAANVDRALADVLASIRRAA